MVAYSNDLRLSELATGEGSGSWGNTTNVNLELISEAFSFGTEAITTNADTHTTTIADGSTDPGRSLFLKYTGTLDSACTITIGPNTVSKLWFIENATSGGFSIIIKQGSGATVTIPNGQTKAIYSDGAGSGGAMVDALQDLSIPDLFIDDDLTFTSDSAVITFGADGDTTLTHTDGSGLTLNSTNKIMFNDASQFIQGSSATVLALGATDEIDLTATAIDVNGTMDVSGALTGTSATFTTADNESQLTLKSTDADADAGPVLDLTRDSGSPADGDAIGRIRYRFDNDAGDEETAIFLDGTLTDASDGTEDASFKIQTKVAGTARNRIDITSSEVVFNEDSQDLDFRAESDGNTHMLFVDAGNDRVGVGVSAPQSNLQVLGTLKVATGNDLGILGLGEASGTTVNAGIFRGAANDPTTGGNFLNLGGFDGIVFAASNASIGSQTERMRITAAGAVTIGGAAAKVAGTETIYVPASAMYPNTTNGCADLTQVELSNGPDLKCLDFDASSDENAQFTVCFPKSWNEGTVTFQAYFTVTGTNTGTVAWGLSGVCIADDASINTSFGTNVVATAKAFSGTSNDMTVTATSGAVTISNAAVDTQTYFQVMRDVSADTQSGDARLLGIKLFFTTDTANDA